MTSLRNFLLLIVVIATLSFTISKEVTKNNEMSLISAGNVSPDFSFEDVNGTLLNLNDFNGKYTYIDIWATWCEPCKEELSHLKNIQNTYADDIQFVSISVDYKKDTDKWKAFINKEQLQGTHLIADKDWYSDFIRAYNITTIPRFILIDPEGKIVDAYAPRPSQKQLTTLFQELQIK